MDDMGEDSCALEVATASVEETGLVVEELAVELEDFAFERERVLSKLDMRAASLARRLARELRVMLRGLTVANGEEQRLDVHETLGELLIEAHGLLEAERSTPQEEAPLESGERITAVDSASELDLPSLVDPDDHPSPEDLTIARKVAWARSGNRLLGG